MPENFRLFTSSKGIQRILRLVGVLVLVMIGIAQTIPPKPASLSAPESTFSASRAMSHVRQIGAKTHPTGSPENSEVRQYLINQISALGYVPEIQSTFATNPKKKQSAFIDNLILKIPGKQSGKALMLVAHYDSVPAGPGAADDAASVAAILETLRVIKTLPTLQNDLICLITDGEELGLLGAQAFVDQHLWANAVGLVLNFEYRGNSGAFLMFETSDGNGKLIAGLAESVSFVMSNSLMYEVYKRLPNDTDFSVFKRAGIPGMNFAAIEGHGAYHTHFDRPEFLNLGTLQQEGEIMLALVKQLGNQSLDNLKAENRSYFDFPGLGIIHYPMSWNQPLCALLVMLFVSLCVINYQSKAISLMPTLISAFGFALLMVGLYFVNLSLWSLVRKFAPNYQAFAYVDNIISYCYLIAFIVFNIIMVGIFYLLVLRWLLPMELNYGVAAVWLLLVLLTLNNGANFLFYWPLLLHLSALTLARWSAIKHKPILKLLILLAGSTPGILLFVPLIKNLFVGLTPSFMAVIMVFLCLIVGLLLPLIALINPNKTGADLICISS